MLVLLGSLILGKTFFKAPLESYAAMEEKISFINGEDLSDYIFQMGGLSEINNQAKTTSLSGDCDEKELEKAILSSIEKREKTVNLCSYKVSVNTEILKKEKQRGDYVKSEKSFIVDSCRSDVFWKYICTCGRSMDEQ